MTIETELRFWGVRGSIACPGPDTVRYGGNTACVEVRCGGRLIVFDAGTGLRPFGQSLQGAPVDADIFLTHCHTDHISGLPFFAPCYDPESRLRVWAGNLLPERKLVQVIDQSMGEPLFPGGLRAFHAGIEFRDFRCGEVLRPDSALTLRTAPLNHPNRATGYRLECGGGVIAYITDTEHRRSGPDPNVLSLAGDADVMIYDCTYTDAEYPDHVGRGHSTWEEGVRLADAAGAKLLVIFHHDPAHDDGFLDRVAEAARAKRPCVVAAEGLTLRLSDAAGRERASLLGG
jgi:phosphoribosyl 1,2-cyclic phosphodiesterase